MAGIALSEAQITPKGFEHDRRWMLVDENDRFMSQREFAEMSLLIPELTPGGLKITYKIDSDFIIIPFEPPLDSPEITVTIWDDTCRAKLVSSKADAWFSNILKIPCRLVYMPDETQRQVEVEFAPKGAVTSFSDAYPYLLIGRSSLDELNNRLEVPVLMNRFRPNIVFTGAPPFAEDSFDSFAIGQSYFNGVKLCARCQVITIDQENASKGKEPSKTLSTYRLKNNKLYFGQNLLGPNEGTIKVDDELIVLKYQTEERFNVNPGTQELIAADTNKTIGIIA